MEHALEFDRDKRTASARAFLQEFGGESKPKTPLIVIAAATAVIAAAVSGFIMWQSGGGGLSNEDRYLARLDEVRMSNPLTDPQIADLQEEGIYYLDSGIEDLSQGEYQRGNSQLKTVPAPRSYPSIPFCAAAQTCSAAKRPLRAFYGSICPTSAASTL